MRPAKTQAEPPAGSFPIRPVLGIVLGFLAGLFFFRAAFPDPTLELPSVAVPPDPLPALQGLRKKKASGELRIFVAGASMTAGYPYQPLGSASYATQLEKGLRACFPGRPIHVRPSAKPALDSPQLLRMVRKLLDYDPSLLVVTLGSNEYANRLFSGHRLVPRGILPRVVDRFSLGRRFWYAFSQYLQGPGGTGESEDALNALIKKVLEAAPGKPALSGLPFDPEERSFLLRRLRRSMREISKLCRAREVPLVFCVAVYGLDGSWPWGLSKGVDPLGRARIDKLVHSFRAGERSAAFRDQVHKALDRFPNAAVLHYLQGQLAKEAGDLKTARASLERARDLDTVPMHLTGPILRSILGEARAEGRPVLVLDDAFAAADQDGLPGPAHYLDYGHLDAEGHGLLAKFLMKELAARSLLPPPPRDWMRLFDTATKAWLDQVLDPAKRARAPTNMAWADGNFALLFGNFREGFYYLKRAFAGNPDNPEFALRLLFCAGALGKKLEAWSRGGKMAKTRRFFDLYEKMRKALEAGKLDAFLFEIAGLR
ncbi:MAG TPA: hypothetical protein ENK02_12165 [Planctomycetes bacterium]|nr:hypothetical protein [Planctomycetota bacterium]